MHHNKSRAKATTTHKTKDKARMDNRNKTSLSHKRRRVMGRRKNILVSGAYSIKSSDECRSKKSLVAELNTSESNPSFDSNSELDKAKQIIDAEPNATVATTKIHPNKLEESEEGERLFHSQMWLKGAPLHFIVDSERQNTLILREAVKQLEFPTKPHPQPYNLGSLSQG